MWPVESSRVVYQNRWIRVDEEQVTTPSGQPGSYGVVTVRHTSVFVVALTETDEVVLVQVDRHTVGRSWEVPAGGTDGEDPLVAAQRELREEAGLAAASWREIGRMTALNGICRAPEIVYLATQLTPAEGAEPDLEGIGEIRRVPWPRVRELVQDGTITDGESIAALMYAALALGRVGGGPGRRAGVGRLGLEPRTDGL